MVRFVRLPAFLFVSTFIASHAFAGEVTGRVVDPDGRAVPGASVLVVSEVHPLQSIVTNARGEFTLEAPDSGRYDVRVSLTGFRGEVRSLDLRQGSLGDIRLSVSGVSESVVVSAAQVEVPLSQTSSTVTVVTREELDAQHVRSVADALRSVPGLTVASTGGTGAVSGVFPRGGESNFTLVFVDDVPVTAFGGEFDFAHLGTENVERIEVVRGPQSALFGSNAIGAVVRVVTRRGGAPAVGGTVEGGGYGTFRVAGATSGSSNGFEWGASGERLESDGYSGQRVPSGFTVENDDYVRSSGSVSAGWRTPRATVRAQVGRSEHERGVPGPFGSNPVGAYTEVDTISRSDHSQTTGSFSAALRITPRVRGLLQTTYHRLQSDFASPFGPSESSSRRLAIRGQLDFPAGRGLELSTGLELQHERAGSTFITGSSSSPIPIRRLIGAVFGEARWSHAERLSVTAGGRLDHVRRHALADLPEDTLVSFNPRASVAWTARTTPGSTTRVRVSAATGIRPPGAFDIAFTDNPSLKPERSRSAEAAVEQSFAGGRARVDAIAFVNQYDDLIVAVGSFRNSSRYTTDNISNARARGFEVALGAGTRIEAGVPVTLHGRVAYTRLDSEVLAVDRDDQAPPPFTVGDPLLRRPDHQFSLQFTAAGGPLTGFVSGGGRSRSLDVEPTLGTFGGLHDAAGFHVWNTGLSMKVGRIGHVFGRIENLFDRTYEEALGFPALGRRATIGLRVAASR